MIIMLDNCCRPNNPLNSLIDWLNDLWRYRLNDSTWTWIAGSLPPQPELPPEAESPATCPPLHQHINNTCIPLLDCSSSEDCVLGCERLSLRNVIFTTDESDTACVIDGDLEVDGSGVTTVNGSIVETNIISIVGVVNVTGNVVVSENVKVQLSIGSVLHVGKCLVLEDESEIVVEINGNEENEHYAHDGTLLATYDSECSTSELVSRVRITTPSSFDECRDGRPAIKQVDDEENGRSRLELLIVPINGTY